MDKRKIVRYLLITLSVILGVLVFLSITGTVAHAAGLVDNTVSDANTYSKYPLENYQLDFYVDSSWDWLPWNWLDGIGKSPFRKINRSQAEVRYSVSHRLTFL